MTFPILPANGPSGYNLTRSLRFRASASAYLNRTPASAGNQQKFTWSGWVKRGKLSSEQAIIVCRTGSSTEFGRLVFNSSDQLDFWVRNSSSTTLLRLVTTQVFRDPSAWYHVVMYVDTTQATAANRAIFYINGVQVTAYGTATYPSQNTNLDFNTANLTAIGVEVPNATYFDGYLAEVNFIDGQALTPSSFGSFNTLTGVWQPAAYTGTYGTNGFELQFTDNSGATATTIGKDFSGNGNNWTPNNISVTAGVTYDSMTDVPTLTSATAGNFAVINRISVPEYNTSTVNPVLTNGNLNISQGGVSSDMSGFSTFPVTSGQWYCEFTCSNPSSDTNFAAIGIAYNYPVSGRTSGILYSPSGNKRVNNTSSAYGSSWTSNDVIGIQLNASSNSVTFYKNNVSQGSISYTPTTPSIFICCYDVNHATPFEGAFNFGQRPFTYTPPTGFVALNTFNLPTSTIVKGNTVMDATLWTGNGATQTITNAAGFKPDFVWAKARSAAYNHILEDSVRGAGKILQSNNTTAEVGNSGDLISSFNSNGFSVNTNYVGSTTDPSTNGNADTYVGWQWQAGQGSSSSNTNGSITSTVSANASAGFSVVTYSGNSVSGATVGHGLGVRPSFIIVKVRNTTGFNWGVWHTSLAGTTPFITLNTTNSASTNSVNAFISANMTSSVIGFGSEDTTNGAYNYVAYCWTPIAGFSSFSSYSGNGSSDGVFVYTGFQPKFIIIKRTDTTGNWTTFDSARDPYNQAGKLLYPNYSNAEETDATQKIDFLSNGFKIRGSNANQNASGGTYVYMAFATAPFKNSLGF